MFTVVQDFLKRFFGYFWFQASSIFNAPFGKENQIFNFFKKYLWDTNIVTVSFI